MSYWSRKVVVVTGASSGLGQALASELVEQDAQVVLAARNWDRLEQTRQALLDAGGDVHATAADVTDTHDAERIVAEAIEHFGRIDAVLCCAGRSTRADILNTTAADFQDFWECNFLGTVRVTQAALDQLVAHRGRIVMIGSLASKVAPRYMGAYPASKFPLTAYAQQLRQALLSHQVKVLLVCPGPIARRAADMNRDETVDASVPRGAQRPGGGARVRAIAPELLAEKILQASERGQAELVVPARAKLLFALSQVSPRLGDWLLRKMTRTD